MSVFVLNFSPFRFDFSVNSKDLFGYFVTKDLITQGAHRGQLEDFFFDLRDRRRRLLRLLNNHEASKEEVDNSLRLYLATILHLENSSRNCLLKFVWKTVLCAPQTATLRSVRFEVLTMLLSVAIWTSNKAAIVLHSSTEDMRDSSLEKASSLYQKAIGIFEFCQIFLTEAELLEIVEITDISPVILEAFTEFIEAESQVLVVLQAIEEGVSPELICGLILASKNRYERASNLLNRRGDSNYSGNLLDKLMANAVHKAACFESLALVFAAQFQLAAKQGGNAVKLAIDAEDGLERAVNLRKVFEIVEPKKGSIELEFFESALREVVCKTRKQADNDNQHVYHQQVPDQRPSLPPVQEQLKSLPFQLPDLISLNSSMFDGLKKADDLPQRLITVISDQPCEQAPSQSEIKGTCLRRKITPELKNSLFLRLIRALLWGTAILLGGIVILLLLPFHLLFESLKIVDKCFTAAVDFVVTLIVVPVALHVMAQI